MIKHVVFLAEKRLILSENSGNGVLEAGCFAKQF